MTINQIIQALHDKGCVGWQLDLDFPNCEVLCLIDQKKRENIVKIFLDETKGVLLVSHWLTDAIDISQNPKIATLLYVALATANDSIVQAGNIGLCQMDISEGCLLFSYVAVLTLGNDANTVADLILLTLPAIALVEPFFDHVEKRANDNVLSVNDVFSFSFQSECVVDVHPMLQLSAETRVAFNTWLESTGINIQLILELFKNSSALEINYVINDTDISFFAFDGIGSIKLDQFSTSLIDDNIECMCRIVDCWDRYIALAAYLNIESSKRYTGPNDLASEIESALL